MHNAANIVVTVTKRIYNYRIKKDMLDLLRHPRGRLLQLPPVLEMGAGRGLATDHVARVM